MLHTIIAVVEVCNLLLINVQSNRKAKNDNNSTKHQLLSQCKQLHSSKYLMIAKPYLKKSMIATTTERQVKALVVILTEIN